MKTRRLRDLGMIHQGMLVFVGVAALVLGILYSIRFIPERTVTYVPQQLAAAIATTTLAVEEPPVFVPRHVDTPEAVKAIYITACTAGHATLREKALTLFEGTELNSVVLDLKDYTGTISYASTSLPTGGRGCRIPDLPLFIERMHEDDIYVIARITVFQDPFYANAHPELAVKSLSDPSGIWRDKNKLAYIDPGAKPYWDYIVDMAKEAYSIGFDEVNFDYIRFPSDGDLSDTEYSWSMGRKKAEVLREFFEYLDYGLATIDAPISADLFGLTTSAADDLGIGQILEDALAHFDYVAPMVYPSHFARGYSGIPKPAERPYDIIKISMSRAVQRAVAATTTPLKLRPWLQDFNLGAIYTPDMVRAQIQATYDSGLTSWMLWNAANIYQKDALLEEGVVDVIGVVPSKAPQVQAVASPNPPEPVPDAPQANP